MLIATPRVVEGIPRTQLTLFPERLKDYIDEESPVAAIEVFIDDWFRRTPDAIKRDGFVGYNAQTAVDAADHLNVAYELTHHGNGRDFLSPMANKARAEVDVEGLWR